MLGLNTDPTQRRKSRLELRKIRMTQSGATGLRGHKSPKKRVLIAWWSRDIKLV